MNIFDDFAMSEYRSQHESNRNNRYREGERLLDVLGLKSMDAVYLHIIEIMSCLQVAKKTAEDYSDLGAAKHRIFWKTIKEISSQEESKLQAGMEGFNTPLQKVREAFPDCAMRTDGRIWLPLHFAMSVPDVSIADVDLLYAAQPETIHRIANDLDRFTPGHLAVMKKEPDIALLRQLKVFNPDFGSCLSADLSTPLHVAAKFSNSVEVIQELIAGQPLALEMLDILNRYPLFVVSSNLNPNAVDILQVFIDSNTATVEELTFNDSVPFLRFFGAREQGSLVRDEMVLKLVEAFPESIYLVNSSDTCIINMAAASLTVKAFQRIAEMDLEQLYWMPETHGGTAAYSATQSMRKDILRYIHSINPALLESITPTEQTILHVVVSNWGCCTDFIELFKELLPLTFPEVLDMEDTDGNNLLHALCYRLEESGREDMSMDNLKYLLHIMSSESVVTMNAQELVAYDIISTGEGYPPDHFRTRARRLLLQAASFWGLYPEMLQQLNYDARKLALFAFFGPRMEGSVDVISRIRDGPGGEALIREILSFF